ncbi:hypothetical protein HanPI659440_Chr15g0602441 [Helianthus annuus]|nr:hypothetical protein HanPI659440_Chr15g0602441 [Helianthus annuus]
MAITHFLLQPNLTATQQTFSYRSTKCHHNNIIPLKRNYYYSPCCIKTSPKLDIKCFITSHKPEGEKGSSLTKAATETGMHGVICRSMESVIKVLQVSVMTGFILGLLLIYDHQQGHVALAASGGRMGGRRSSSSRSSSRSSSGRSRSRSHSSRSSRPSYSSSGSYRTLVGSPAPINTAEAEQNGFHVFMGYSILVCLAVFAIKGLVDAQDAAKISVLKLQVL